jgi:hypothetical protein
MNMLAKLRCGLNGARNLVGYYSKFSGEELLAKRKAVKRDNLLASVPRGTAMLVQAVLFKGDLSVGLFFFGLAVCLESITYEDAGRKIKVINQIPDPRK